MCVCDCDPPGDIRDGPLQGGGGHLGQCLSDNREQRVLGKSELAPEREMRLGWFSRHRSKASVSRSSEREPGGR